MSRTTSQIPSTTEEGNGMRTEDMDLEDTGGTCSMEVVQLEEQQGENGEDEDGNGKDRNIRKQMAERSEIWQHFTKIKDDNDVVKKAKCKYSGRELKADTYQNGTSALKRHLNICKQNPDAKNKDPKSATLAATKGEGVTWKYDPEAMKKAFAEMVIEDEMPFVTGEKRGVKKFMSVACPGWSPPSRRTATRSIVQIYFQEKAKLKLFLKDNCERVSLTTDGWTSQQQECYMAVTAHFIDKNWQYHRKVISFFKVKGHKGDDIGKNLQRCLLDWGLEKVMCVTVDNASSNDSGVSYLRRLMNSAKTSIAEGKHKHFRCSAHTVNLIVQDGLKEVDTSVKRVRAAVKYIKDGTSRLAKFKELVEEEKVQAKAFMNLDICTRWNSTYLMLQAATSYDKVFQKYCDDDPRYTIDLSPINKGPGHPDEEDWEKAKKMAEFLGHFYRLTECLSKNPQVNAHNFLFEIAQINFLIGSWMSSKDPLRQEMGKRMKLKFDKYWGNWHDQPAAEVRHVNERGKGKGKDKDKEKENLNLLIFVAVVLDPRYKLTDYTKLTIDEIFTEENSPKVWAAVKSCVHDLFEEYRNIYAPSSNATVQTDDSQETPEAEAVKHRIAKKLKRHGAASGGVKSELPSLLSWWKRLSVLRIGCEWPLP